MQYRDMDKMCISKMGIHDKIAVTKSPCVISCLNQSRVYSKRRTIRGMLKSGNDDATESARVAGGFGEITAIGDI